MSALRVFAIVALALAAFTARVAIGAHQELNRGDRYRHEGDIDSAIVHYRRAARGYVPAGRDHVRALDRLDEIAAGARRAGRPEHELAAQRAIRSALMSSRSLYIPERARLVMADERIAAEMARLLAPAIDAGKKMPELELEQLALLDADPGPGVFWSGALLLGFGVWVGATFVLTTRGVDAQNRFVPRALRRWGAWFAVGFGLFVLGMSLA